ncbi:MAG: helix-turn-helix domain-containing protein [Planctomycetaceae bacterium]
MTITNSTSIPQLLLKPPEAARALAISERTLATLTADGTLPSVKLGGSRRYRIKDLEAYLDGLQSESADGSAVT